jgi:hypothetical protein
VCVTNRESQTHTHTQMIETKVNTFCNNKKDNISKAITEVVSDYKGLRRLVLTGQYATDGFLKDPVSLSHALFISLSLLSSLYLSLSNTHLRTSRARVLSLSRSLYLSLSLSLSLPLSLFLSLSFSLSLSPHPTPSHSPSSSSCSSSSSSSPSPHTYVPLSP